MRLVLRVSGSLLVAFLFALHTRAADPPPLQMIVRDNGVDIANVSPGGQCVILMASIESADGALRHTTGVKVLTDDDKDGTVSYGTRVVFRSVFIATDVETGRYALGAPAGYRMKVLPFPTRLLKQDADGILGLFDSEQLASTMLIVRPKTGAWRLLTSDGGGADADALRNGKISLRAADAELVAGAHEAPKRLKNGDVVAVINPGRLDVFVTEIGK